MTTDQRWAAVRNRLQAAVGEALDDASDVRERSLLSLVCRGISHAERIAAAVEVGMVALRLQGDIMEFVGPGAPSVHLHLSIEQAERVLAALRGTP